jgi:hypothetical protein
MRNTDCAVHFSRYRQDGHVGPALFDSQKATPRQGKLAAYLYRMPLRSLLATVSVIVLSSNYAFAADCGPIVGGSVTCTPPAPIGADATGIIYNPVLGGLVLNVKNGFVINRTTGPDNDGIRVTESARAALTVDIADGVTITTDGLNADGVEVTGTGNITIRSGANINVTTPGGAPLTSITAGLFGRSDIGGNGDIDIDQRGGTITVTGFEGIGLYGLNYGSGSVALTSSGIVSTAGERGYGLMAWNRGGPALKTRPLRLMRPG